MALTFNEFVEWRSELDEFWLNDPDVLALAVYRLAAVYWSELGGDFPDGHDEIDSFLRDRAREQGNASIS